MLETKEPEAIIPLVEFQDTTTDIAIPGSDQLEVQSVSDSVQVASVFNATTNSRRSLASKGSYDIQDKTAYVKFSIDPSTTSGNIAELWLYNAPKFIQTSLIMAPTATVTRAIAVAYSAGDDSAPQTASNPCTFALGVVYQLRVGILFTTKWQILAELRSSSNAVLCSIALEPIGFNSRTFFDSSFSFVLSQSASGTAVKRRIMAQEQMSINVKEMGVACKTSECSSIAPTSPKTYSSINVGLIAGLIAAIAGVMLVALIIAIIVVGVIAKRRKRKQHVVAYAPSDEQAFEEPPVEPTEERSAADLVHYEAFQEQQ
jgi:hypothetical protein